MGHRLSKIVTRTGDTGTTGLADNTRVAKTDARVAALGDVDELNSQLGVLLALELPATVRGALTRVQHELFNLGGEISLPGSRVVNDEHIAALEASVEKLNEPLPPLKEFVLPGGNVPAAAAHLARAVCRRAERALWVLNEAAPLNPNAMRYLNRLSDLLFVCGRILARENGGTEVVWKRN